MKKEFLLFHLWKKYGVLSIFILGMCITASAQNRLSITGIVVDSLDATPLPGVTVMVQGTPNGMQTDLNGRFTIKVDPGAVLIFNFIGYRKQKVEVKDQTQLKVRLTPSAQDIKEVVVVAYGQQKKVSVTGAISSVGRISITPFAPLTPNTAVAEASFNTVMDSTSFASIVRILSRGTPSIRINGFWPLVVAAPRRYIVASSRPG